jgi:glycosyltransferase involved in cell wall biosynthesis
MTQPNGQRTILILLPVYNDWEPLDKLLDLIDAVLAGLDLQATVLLVDDASSDRPDPAKFRRRFVALSEIHLLCLRRNLGHQRAIAIGLAFAHENFAHDLVLVMDADGQDAPQEFDKLLTRHLANDQAAIFAERKRRSEGLVFRFFYWLFRVVHRLLTGHSARVGNFSLLPRPLLRRAMVLPELWNNYSAAIYKARLPIETVPVDRAKRIAGKTHMNFSTLVSHGLSAMSIFNDVIGVRTLSTAILLTLLTFVAAVGLGVYHFAWQSTRLDAWLFAVLMLLATLIVVCGVLACFLLITLAHRTTSTFLPLRDYRFYYDSVQRLDS